MKSSNDIYQYVVEKAKDVFYSVSLDSQITFHNKAIEDIFEAPLAEIQEKKYYHYMLPKDKEFAKKLHEERLQGKSAVFEHGFITPKGKLVFLECSVTPLFDEDGSVNGSFGIARDITDRKNAEQKLKESKLELEDQIHLKDKFLSIIAHDLRDPFNILIGYSDLILNQLNDVDQEKLEKYIQAINISSNNAYNLLNNLLDWSKSESRKINYTPEEFNISKTIDHVVASLNYAASAKEIMIRKKYEDHILVYCDENMLKTVLRNLIGNAIKFSYKKSELFIKVSTEKHQLIVSIADTGIGMNEETLEKIFLPESQFTKPGTVNERGTGLGLKISKEFVTEWGGRIWVDSTFGKGSTFSFSIPKKAG